MGVPSVNKDQHSARTLIECNVTKMHSVPDNEDDSTSGNTKIRASNHKVKRRQRGTLID
mgnify:CR=1 FL=1